MFFDDHPEFLETSETATSKKRLDLRHRVMIEDNAKLLDGKRVLDIASHDGRWSFAALDAGAAHVTGIEGRPEMVKHAEHTIAAKGIDQSRYTFIAGDAHDILNDEPPKVDVVMCLGFLYHTLRYAEILAGIRATGAEHVIIDTRVATSKAPVIRVSKDPVHVPSMAVEDRFSSNGFALSGNPSMSALELMLDTYGYAVESVADWGKVLSSLSNTRLVERYARGERITLVARRFR